MEGKTLMPQDLSCKGVKSHWMTISLRSYSFCRWIVWESGAFFDDTGISSTKPFHLPKLRPKSPTKTRFHWTWICPILEFLVPLCCAQAFVLVWLRGVNSQPTLWQMAWLSISSGKKVFLKWHSEWRTSRYSNRVSRRWSQKREKFS